MDPKLDTLALEQEELVILDQTLLPGQTKLLRLRAPGEIREAIVRLRVRGAPAIGVSAAIGLYVSARQYQGMDPIQFVSQVRTIADYLASARPTAVNLSWALGRMTARLDPALPVDAQLRALRQEAVAIRDQDVAVCRRIGEEGARLLAGGMGVLTHCNAGRLAAVRYGTALAPLYVAKERGMRLSVYVDETRPLLQGARLTAYELHEAGLPVTLLCDNMASQIMREGRVQAVLVGCDRVAANGDTANKIGTSGVAILARHYHIPFYVCAPTSTIDLACANGAAIPIEQRAPEEVTQLWYRDRMAPEGIHVYNPAFDVTGASLITAFITEKGLVPPPFGPGLRGLLGC